jgi:hypothetical protein
MMFYFNLYNLLLIFILNIGVTIKSIKTKWKSDEELATFIFEKKLKVGEGRLNINYTGKLNDDMLGFYRVEYNHEFSKSQYTVTTQFEVFF